MVTPNIGILISGRGSNMQAIVRACDEGRLAARVALVISNVASAPGVEWAREHGLAVEVIPHHAFAEREAHDGAMVAALRAAAVDWVCLAGYMRLLSDAFVAAFPSRIVNIHPSLLPAFPGLHAQQQAIAYGVKVSGCTVHLVDSELDHGPIVIQTPITVRDGDDADRLSARILELEHRAYVEGLSLLLSGKWMLQGRRLVTDP